MLGLGTSILSSSGASSENVALSVFKRRVQDDGGSTESGLCLDNAFEALNVQDSNINLMRRFETRVRADGGIVEDNTCMLTEIKSLSAAKSRQLQLLRDFEDRVGLDGGTFESNNCALDAIADLI